MSLKKQLCNIFLQQQWNTNTDRWESKGKITFKLPNPSSLQLWITSYVSIYHCPPSCFTLNATLLWYIEGALMQSCLNVYDDGESKPVSHRQQSCTLILCWALLWHSEVITGVRAFRAAEWHTVFVFIQVSQRLRNRRSLQQEVFTTVLEMIFFNAGWYHIFTWRKDTQS